MGCASFAFEIGQALADFLAQESQEVASSRHFPLVTERELVGGPEQGQGSLALTKGPGAACAELQIGARGGGELGLVPVVVGAQSFLGIDLIEPFGAAQDAPGSLSVAEREEAGRIGEGRGVVFGSSLMKLTQAGTKALQLTANFGRDRRRGCVGGSDSGCQDFTSDLGPSAGEVSLRELEEASLVVGCGSAIGFERVPLLSMEGPDTSAKGAGVVKSRGDGLPEGGLVAGLLREPLQGPGQLAIDRREVACFEGQHRLEPGQPWIAEGGGGSSPDPREP